MAEVLEQEKRRAEAHAAQLTEQANARVAAAEMRAHAELQVLVLVSKVVAVLVHLLSCRCDIAIIANMLLNGLVCDRGYVLQYMTVCLLGVCVGYTARVESFGSREGRGASTGGVRCQPVGLAKGRLFVRFGCCRCPLPSPHNARLLLCCLQS